MLVVLDSKLLRDLFREVKPIYKSAGEGALMSWELGKHILSVTCKNGIVYEKQMACEQAGPYTITVLYQDLSELLSGTGTVQLDLQPKYIGITTDTLQTTLIQAHGMLSKYAPRTAEYQQCASSELQWLASKFADMAPVSKSLKSEASILCVPPYAIMKYTTMWLQVGFRGFNTSMSLSDLRAVANFKPSEFAVSDEVIEFRRRGSLLALPRTGIAQCKSVADVLQEPQEPRRLWSADMLNNIQQFQRSVGPGPCFLRLYEDGYQVIVDNPKFKCAVTYGKCTEHIYTLSTYVEYLPMLFRIFDTSNFFLTVGKNAVAFQQDDIILLHSVI